MDTTQFLARVSPPGSFIVVGYDRGGAEQRFTNTFFQAGEFQAAADLLQWAAWKKYNAYHGMASFKMAEPGKTTPKGVQTYRGERKIKNAAALKAFWIDLDVKRQGDGKADGHCYASPAEALSWVAGFKTAFGIPRPNLVVNSGYGLHVYWVLEDALPTDDWLRYAHGFKAAMVAHGFRGDAGISSDASRVLRPPGSLNVKVAAQPRPVTVLDRLTGPDVVNQLLLDKLQPWMVAQGQVQHGQQAASTAQALGAGQVANIFQARVAAYQAGGAGGGAMNAIPDMNAAAQANLPESVPKSFTLVAQQCAQVSHSLIHHGDGDSRPIWYLGHLTLAHFCQDGAQFVHSISDGDARYSQAETDAMVAQIATEVKTKGSGAPTCQHYEAHRPALCQSCPHRGRINSPIALGVPQSDLPAHYRRNVSLTQIERAATDQDGNQTWKLVLSGDAINPRLHSVGRGKAISFTHTRAGDTVGVYTAVGDIPDDKARLRAYFDRLGVTLQVGAERSFQEFLMAWINTLIDRRAKRAVRAEPWGWIEGRHGIEGFAVGGRLFRKDGTMDSTAVAHASLEEDYTPRGSLEKWRSAFDFVCAGKPELQTIVAAAFGAPLMKLMDYNGVVISAWSKESGVGKSSAMVVAQGVWASPAAMFALNDTTNSTFELIASTRSMPAFWDEARVVTDLEIRNFISMVFQLTQGKERRRMRADTSLRDVRLWETMLVCAANRPLMDQIIALDEGTEAGAVRVFEYPIRQSKMDATPGAQNMVGLARSNYGVAGDVYARWLAAHSDKARAALAAAYDGFVRALQAAGIAPESSERFYLAGMTTMYVGATIAKKIGVADFELQALHRFLVNTFVELRLSRRREVSVSELGYDLEEILSRFISAHSARRLTTDQFARPGHNKVEIRWRPSSPIDGVAVHVSEKDGAMRIARHVFYEWCRKKNYSGANVIEAMQLSWVAKVERVVLGGGTPFAIGQCWVVEIPLAAAPSLAGFLSQDTVSVDPSRVGSHLSPSERVRRNGLPNTEDRVTV